MYLYHLETGKPCSHFLFLAGINGISNEFNPSLNPLMSLVFLVHKKILILETFLLLEGFKK